MTHSRGLPPEERLPEEIPAPAPAVCPPPEEDAAGESSGRRRRRKTDRRGRKSALLLAFAGVMLCGAIYADPVKPAAAARNRAETAVTQPVTEPEPMQLLQTPEPEETPEAPPTDAQRLVAAGTWKNAAENEWVRFYEDGSGWWYDGTYFGRMEWREDDDGGVSYAAAIAYLGDDWDHSLDYEFAPEKEGLTVNKKQSDGSVELLSEEDSFACPGLLFGEGVYLPDDTPIDASVMDGVRGKSNLELIAGTAWHVEETSDLGIPCYPTEQKYEYTDKVYVQSIDFAAGSIRLATRDGGLLEREIRTADKTEMTGEMASALSFHFTLPADVGKVVPAFIRVNRDNQHYCYRSDYRPVETDEDVSYNNEHILFGVDFSSNIYLLFTASGLRLGMYFIDWYLHNYTILAPD